MLQLTPHLRILLAVAPTDFRRGIDGLCRVCREHLDADPMSGAVFVFRNRRAKALKILIYDGQGFWLCQKRLSAGRFRFWPTSKRGGRTRRLEAHELQVLLAGGDPEAARGARPWRRIGEEFPAARVHDPFPGSPTTE
ncbi:MAG: IS66 family insertion sequence element accessory protein TnpB [Pseudomonadota bacterium]